MTKTAAKPTTPFVGRQIELCQLQQWLESVIANKRSKSVLIQGDFGMGKSALVKHFLAEVSGRRDQPILVGQGRCELETGGSGLLPFSQLLVDLIEKSIQRGIMSGDLWDFIEEVAPAWLEVAGAVVKGAGQTAEEGSKPPEHSTYSQDNVFVQFTNALTKLAEKQPVVAFIDDLHWADASSMSLVFHLARCLQDRAVLMVCTYRPVEGLVTGSNAELFCDIRANLMVCGAVELELRQGIDVATYINQRYPGHTFPPELAARIQEHTGGHPLFVNQLFLWWEETGAIAPQPSPEGQTRWVLCQEARDLIIPPSLGTMLDERLRRMADDLKEMLADASVEGEDFTAQTITNLMRLDKLRTYRALKALKDKYQMITGQGTQEIGSTLVDLYRFAHRFFREHVYGRLEDGERRTLHQMVGETLESLFADRRPIAGQLARHFGEAYQRLKAARYALIAAQFEQSRYTWAECQKWCEVGLGLLEKLSLDEEIRQLQEAAASTRRQLAEARENLRLIQEREEKFVLSTDVPLQLVKDERRWQNEIAGLGQQLDGAASMSKQALQLDLLEQLGEALYYSGRFSQAGKAFRDALDVAQQLPADAERMAGLCTSLVDVGEYEGRYDEAMRFLDLGRQILRDHAVPFGETHIILESRGGFMQTRTAGSDAAILSLRKLLADAAPLPPTPALERAKSDIYNSLGIAMGNLGHHAESIAFYQQSIDISTKLGGKETTALSLLNIAESYLDNGDVNQCITSVAEGLKMSQQLGELDDEAYAYSIKGNALMALGKPQEAADELTRAIAMSEQIGSEWNMPAMYADLAMAYLALSDTTTAYEQAKQAVDCAENGHFELGYALEALAQVEAARQDWEPAAQHFSQAITFHQEKGYPQLAAEAQRYFAKALLGKGERPQAIKLLQTALATFQELGLTHEVAETHRFLDAD